MKKAHYGSMPIPTPDIPANIAGLSKFAYQVRAAIKALRDRPVLYSQGNSSQRPFTHPWKVTPNGDNTVTIAEGSVLSWNTSNSGSFPNEPFYAEDVIYAGSSSVTVTTGTLFAVVPANVRQVSNDGNYILSVVYIVNTGSSITVEVGPTYTGSNLYIPIADITVTDGVAAVDRQILTYNPILQMGYTYQDSP